MLLSPVVELILCQLDELVLVVVKGVTDLDGGLLGDLDVDFPFPNIDGDIDIFGIFSVLNLEVVVTQIRV